MSALCHKRTFRCTSAAITVSCLFAEFPPRRNKMVDPRNGEQMLPSRARVEPLPELAAEAYELARRRCGACCNSHALWSYIRLSRASIGAEWEGSALEPLLAELLITDQPVILIAGAQDTGLLALVARADQNVMPISLCWIDAIHRSRCVVD
jgi:hypothetical protein